MRSSLLLRSDVPVSQFGRFRPLYPSRPSTSSASSSLVQPRPLSVPPNVQIPHYVPRDFFGSPKLPKWTKRVPKGGPVKLGGAEEQGVRAAGRLAKQVLDRAEELVMVRPNRTTSQ
jgi:hypothetical protein